jgi:uncharacterized protein (TIGR03067 family)
MKLSILVLSLILAGDGGDGPKAETDQERIQGTWKITALHVGDHDLVVDGYESVEFKDDKMFITRNGNRFPQGSTFKLDPTKSPRTFDLTEPQGDVQAQDDAKSTYEGIYELDGPRLRFCYNSKKRPTKFETNKQMGEPRNVLYELERK